jgi:hypothetical protein
MKRNKIKKIYMPGEGGKQPETAKIQRSPPEPDFFPCFWGRTQLKVVGANSYRLR